MLTREQLERFHTDGFVVGPAIRSAEAMDRTREAIDAVLASNGFAGDPTAHRHLDARIVHDLCADPTVVECAAAILGPNLLLWHSRFFDKPPGSGPIPWHQDKPFWPIEPDVCLSVWIAIDRADWENGCVEVIPGSHRRKLPHITSTDTGRFTQMAEPDYVDETGKVTMELEPGQFFLFDRWLLHRSPPNGSNRRRLGLSARIVPDGVTIDFDRMSPHFPQLGAQVIRGEVEPGVNRLVPAPPRSA
jgi:ectoine hydroxylase-related dioxygenase (phytanoyl-CoA dioxygenase family)